MGLESHVKMHPSPEETPKREAGEAKNDVMCTEDFSRLQSTPTFTTASRRLIIWSVKGGF